MTSTSLPDSLIATLPGSSYTDPGIFAQEQERIFETMWFCAARASELAKPGAFRTVDVGRESILVTRAREQASSFAGLLKKYGARVFSGPAIRVVPAGSFRHLDAAIRRLDTGRFRATLPSRKNVR